MISHNSSRNIRLLVHVVSGMVHHGMRIQPVLLRVVSSVVIILLQLFLPHHLQLFKPEPAVLPDQHGIRQRTVVSHRPVESDNSTVLLKRNVSQDEPLVTQRCVTTMASVNEKNLANVETV